MYFLDIYFIFALSSMPQVALLDITFTFQLHLHVTYPHTFGKFIFVLNENRQRQIRGFRM